MFDDYTIHITFLEGQAHQEYHTGHKALIRALRRLVNGPAAAAGIIQRVQAVDVLDTTVFLAKFQRGKLRPVFPRPSAPTPTPPAG